jgi:hypothetical protein
VLRIPAIQTPKVFNSFVFDFYGFHTFLIPTFSSFLRFFLLLRFSFLHFKWGLSLFAWNSCLKFSVNRGGGGSLPRLHPGFAKKIKEKRRKIARKAIVLQDDPYSVCAITKPVSPESDWTLMHHAYDVLAARVTCGDCSR